MPALEAYVAGVPVSGLEILSTALESVFGSNGVEIKTLSKEDLRFNIRAAGRRDTVVFVVLDGASKAFCAEIENGLYAQDKFYEYTTDSLLVGHLNEYFGLELDMPESIDVEVPAVETVSTEARDALVERYEDIISGKDALITTLQARTKELERIVEDGEYPSAEVVVDTAEVDRLSSENSTFRSQISDLEQQVRTLTASLESAKVAEEDAKSKLEASDRRLSSITADLDNARKELSEERVSSSQKSGVIRDREAEISRLKNSQDGLTKYKGMYEGLLAEKATWEESEANSQRELSSLTSKIDEKDREIARLQDEIATHGVTSEQIEGYKRDIREAEADKRRALAELDERDREIESLRGQVETFSQTMSESEEYLRKLEEQVDQDNETITALNEEKIRLDSRISILEGSTSRDANMEGILTQYNDLKKEYDAISSGIFSRISANAMPNTSARAVLFGGLNLRLQNVRFVFAGSTDSRKGSYKSILKEIRDKKDNYLIVDAVSETSVDYVFEIAKMKSGIQWFTSGGGVLSYLSDTRYSHIKVLSTGLNYVNDSFLLTVEWYDRLKELENCGYKVIVFCGDISNLIGRVLFETFAMVGETTIYTHGNAVSSRSLVVNMRGMNNIKNAVVTFFDYDRQMDRFFQLARKYCKSCNVANYVR